MRDFARLRAPKKLRTEVDVVMRSLTCDITKKSDLYVYFFLNIHFWTGGGIVHKYQWFYLKVMFFAVMTKFNK